MSGAEIATSLLGAGLSPYKILNVLYFPFSVSTRSLAVCKVPKYRTKVSELGRTDPFDYRG